MKEKSIVFLIFKSNLNLVLMLVAIVLILNVIIFGTGISEYLHAWYHPDLRSGISDPFFYKAGRKRNRQRTGKGQAHQGKREDTLLQADS